MHRQQPTRKWLAALIGVVFIGSWCPEALGQVGAEKGKTEKEIRLEPLKSASLEVLSREYVEQKPNLSARGLLMIEKWPELIGGLRGLVEEMQYPESARRNGIQGVVYLSFVVNEQGFVEQVVVEKGIGGACDAEAVRVIRQALFKPGILLELTSDGNLYRSPVKVPMSLPFTFKLGTFGYVSPFDVRIP